MKVSTGFLAIGLSTSVAATNKCASPPNPDIKTKTNVFSYQCEQIQHVLPQKTSFPNSASYNATEAAYFSLQESTLTPACIIHPTTTQDASLAMGVISKNPKCLFAIKGRGHTPAAGFANIQDGVTIDMTRLSGIAVNPDHSVTHVGAGAAWLDVYKYLEPLNLAVAGGRNGNVGVGGLLLGGGISHFTTRVGWACDNVVNYEVVLSNGQIIQANSTSHTSLYQSLKGGSNNFGVITRFDLKTFPQSNISVTSIVSDISYIPQVFHAFTDIITTSPFDVDTSLVTGLLFNSASRKWTLTNSAVYAKAESKPDVFRNLSAIPNISNGTVITSLAKFADEKPTPPLNWVFSTATFKPSSSFMVQLFDILNTTLYEFNPAGGVVWSVALEPIAGEMLSTGETLGMKTTEKGYLMLLSALWPDSTSRESVAQTARDALFRLESAARAQGLLQRFQYLNYAAPYQMPLESYGKDQFRLLKQVSHQYDGHGILQRQLKGGYKLL